MPIALEALRSPALKSVFLNFNPVLPNFFNSAIFLHRTLSSIPWNKYSLEYSLRNATMRYSFPSMGSYSYASITLSLVQSWHSSHQCYRTAPEGKEGKFSPSPPSCSPILPAHSGHHSYPAVPLWGRLRGREDRVGLWKQINLSSGPSSATH